MGPGRRDNVGGKRGTVEERFWRRVVKADDPDECWSWLGSTANDYGQLAAPSPPRQPPLTAHRVSWEIHNGPVPDGLHVLHRCDNPPCTNPRHLFLGTNDDNIADMHSKARQRGGSMPGASNPAATLSQEQVDEIRTKATGAWGEAARLAREYDVGYHAVRRILRGDTWC